MTITELWNQYVNEFETKRYTADILLRPLDDVTTRIADPNLTALYAKYMDKFWIN